MPRFRKKPVEITAEQFIYAKHHPRGVMFRRRPFGGQERAYVITVHGQQTWVESGDWIIPEPDGEHYYPCKDEVFRETYDPVEATP